MNGMTGYIAPLLLLALSVVTVQAQSMYTADGAPSNLEEELRWLVNRMRSDPAAENTRMGTDYDVPGPLQPLAPNQALLRAAERHSEDMARNGSFSHLSPAATLYYTPGFSAGQRMTAEGYDWEGCGENISRGFGDPSDTYADWWNSPDEREVMLDMDRSRECGIGYYYWLLEDPFHFWTIDIASENGWFFFTDTIFFDANRNGEYDAGEGVDGVQVWLQDQGGNCTYYDSSEACGSFAVPMNEIVGLDRVEVFLVNNAATPRNVSIPKDADSLRIVNLPSRSGGVNIGYFHQPLGGYNLGFRSLAQRLNRFWEDASGLGDGWKWLEWFGYFNDVSDPWINHNQHGWMYSASGRDSDIWLYTQDMGWLWTSAGLYPYIYRSGDGAWLWYQQGSKNPRWFNNLSTGSWEQH